VRAKILLAFAVATVALLAASCDWPLFRGDAAHDGFSPFETTLSASNVSKLKTDFTAPLSGVPGSPVVANGTLFVVDTGISSFQLRAYSAVGTTNCSGSHLSCQPLWTATLPTGGLPVPAVANGVVYVVAGSFLYAFDQNGTMNCSGTPKMCIPLWQSADSATDSPTVANGVVYVIGGSGGSGVAAYDAAGMTNCSGSPKVCSPLWVGTESDSTVPTGSPTYANGVVYISAQHLYAFDGAGHTGCSGTPTVCVPLWSAFLGNPHTVAPPTAVSAGIVYAVNSTASVLYAFDATGTSGCSGSPKTCTALWTASGVSGSPAIARGTLYIVGAGSIDAYDATGTTNCSGSPKVCMPLRSYAGGSSISGGPIVANDVLYSTANGLTAFDANGSRGCSGNPVVCNPLFNTVAGAAVFGGPAVANGVVYFADGDPFSAEHQLFALKLPSKKAS
jgi:hypothetical protein